MTEQETRRIIVERVLSIYPGTRKIVLFGSRVHGRARADSDYDVMVMVDSKLSPAKRAVPLHLALRDLGHAFDLMVVTPEEFERNVAWRSSIVHIAATEGEALYEAT
jgi:uncharacterized protein